MNRVEVSYMHGEYPSTRTDFLEGLKVGADFDEPREGLLFFKIWANTRGKEQTFSVPADSVISWKIEIDKRGN